MVAHKAIRHQVRHTGAYLPRGLYVFCGLHKSGDRSLDTRAIREVKRAGRVPKQCFMVGPYVDIEDMPPSLLFWSSRVPEDYEVFEDVRASQEEEGFSAERA